jgi:septal ring factor EnvC (AmiA/AmiB activator)
MDQATKDAFAAVTKRIETGFAAVAEDIADIKKSMATKDDLATLRTELKSDIAALSTQIASIENDLKSIRRDLNELRDQVENIAGFRKEIDHAFDRIAAIEKHLGITHKIAA